jgi:hypothetical protein
LKSLSFFNVVISQKMQESVDNQMGKMRDKSNPQCFGFADEGFISERNVADEPRQGCPLLELGKAQDVGRLVDLPPGAVEDPLMGVIGEQN